MNQIFEGIKRRFEVDTNIVKIGATQTISMNYLQSYLLDMKVELFTNNISQLVNDLKKGLIDCIVINRKLDDLDIEVVSVTQEPISWVKGKHYHEQDNRYVVSRDIGCPYRHEVLSYLEMNTIQATILEVDTMDMLISTVEKGIAKTVLPNKTVLMNKLLFMDASIYCKPCNLYVYTLVNSSLKLEIVLSMQSE